MGTVAPSDTLLKPGHMERGVYFVNIFWGNKEEITTFRECISIFVSSYYNTVHDLNSITRGSTDESQSAMLREQVIQYIDV